MSPEELMKKTVWVVTSSDYTFLVYVFDSKDKAVDFTMCTPFACIISECEVW